MCSYPRPQIDPERPDPVDGGAEEWKGRRENFPSKKALYTVCYNNRLSSHTGVLCRLVGNGE